MKNEQNNKELESLTKRIRFKSLPFDEKHRMEVGNGSDVLRELSRKIDSKKRQLHTMGNWRNKNNHNSSVLIGMIMPIDNHISPEEGQGFF